MDFARIVLNLYFFFFRFCNQNQGFRYDPLDISLQFVKLF